MMRVRVRCLAGIGLVVALFVSGCSDSAGVLPDLATVSGTVTMGGEPLSGASVLFESASGHAASGITDANGRYELQFVGETMGAALGVNTVRITTVLDHATPPGYEDPIPSKYNEDSELKVTVEPGANTHDFALDR